MFTQRLYEETQRLGVSSIEVDPTMTLDALTGRVEEMFAM
jgi:hypothetical protein